MGSMTRSARGAHTRTAIIDAALGLFEEVGYDATTMRSIADRAGVSVGNAYYYFASKDHLIQGFYDRAAELHGDASAARVDGLTEFGARLHGHLDAWFELMGGYHQFAAAFFRIAADPASPMSPFSPESVAAREVAIERFRTIVDGSDLTVPDHVRAELPELLWLYHMGLILFWVHDRTPDQVATRLAVARTVPLLNRAIRLVDVPELRALIDDVISLINLVRTATT